MNDKQAEAFVARLIAVANGPKIPDISTRALFATLAKRLGLTMSYAILRWNL